jgi:signal transduction histidine kinase
MSGWSIRTRVLFLALAPCVLILLSLVVYFTYQAIAQVDVSLAERGKLIARRLAAGTEYAIFAGDRAALQQLTDAAAGEADVASIAIEDANGQDLAHSGPGAGAAVSLTFSEAIRQTRVAVTDFAESGNEAGRVVGNVTVVMSRLKASERQRELLLSGLVIGLFGFAVAIGLALLIGNTVVRPVRRLANAIGALGSDRRFTPISTAGGGELGMLAEGFNRMAASLAADARELEARVAHATRALTAQKEAAEQATQAKSRFIAAASHDLRQPLHAIGLFTSALQRRAHDDELRGTVADLAAAVGIMERQFASLLDISRLDAGTLHAQPRAFAIARLFDQLAAEYAEAALKKGLRLRFRAAGAVVVCDELLLHRILSNLVANAIRYTRSGGVLVCCRRRGDTIRIVVRYCGIGIAREKQADIFLEFYRVGDVHTDGSMGLGLGLAIVTRLAALVGTKVTVRSAPGAGSTFALDLPRADAEVVAAPVDAAPTLAGATTLPLQVLVVDDDPLVLAGNRALLEQFGCRVASASDLGGALAAVEAFEGDDVLVLCDFWLGDGANGIDLLRRLAGLTAKRISGILVSGDTRPETLQAAQGAGLLLLHKPVAPARLRAAVMDLAARLRNTATVR